MPANVFGVVLNSSNQPIAGANVTSDDPANLPITTVNGIFSGTTSVYKTYVLTATALGQTKTQSVPLADNDHKQITFNF